jgi:hypothetical protein
MFFFVCVKQSKKALNFEKKNVQIDEENLVLQNKKIAKQKQIKKHYLKNL